VVLDPFFGSGTTGAVAKKLHRRWIGIEREPGYIEAAQQRIDAVTPAPFDATAFDVRDQKRLQPRIAFCSLLEHGLIQPGQILCFRQDRTRVARVKPDGKLRLPDGFEGSIHQAGKQLMDGSPCNGWDHWYFEATDGALHPIDQLRQAIQSQAAANEQTDGR
jgi:modification methylase